MVLTERPDDLIPELQLRYGGTLCSSTHCRSFLRKPGIGTAIDLTNSSIRTREAAERARHYYNVMAALEAQGDKAGIARVELQILALEDELKEIDFRLPISGRLRLRHLQHGAFGPDVIKIGLTRRLDPLDRIRELGSAAVPYRYDVHALFFSADAVAIETMLHCHFDDRRVNRVNRRKEFFRVRPDEVLAVLGKHDAELVDWVDEAEADEYRIGLTLGLEQHDEPDLV